MRLGPYSNSLYIATLSLVAPYSQKLEAAPAAIGAADALYNIARSPTGLSSQWVPILNNLESLNGTSISSAVSQTLPVLIGASSLSTAQVQSQINQITRRRQDVLSQAMPGQSFAKDQPVWSQAFGNWGAQGGLNNVSGYNTDTGGLAFGFDKGLTPNAHVGLSFGFAQSQVTSQSATAPSSLDMSNYQASLYGLYNPAPDWQWVYQVGAAMNNNRSSRTLSRFSEVGNIGNATAQFNSYVGFAGLGLQKRFTMTSTTTLAPEIRLDYMSVQTEGYTETGAGNLNLNVASQTFNTLYTTLGLRVDHALDERLTLQPMWGQVTTH